MWTVILTRMKKYIEPSGHEIVNKIMGTVARFDKALLENDNPSISKLYRTIGPLYKELVPYIKNNKALAEVCSFIGDGSEQLAEKEEANKATARDVAAFVRIAARKIIRTLI